MKKFSFTISLILTITACSSSTKEGQVGADRRQLLLLPSSQIEQMSAQAYEQTKAEAQKKGALDRNPQQLSRLQTVMRRLQPHTAVFRKDAPGWAGKFT